MLKKFNLKSVFSIQKSEDTKIKNLLAPIFLSLITLFTSVSNENLAFAEKIEANLSNSILKKILGKKSRPASLKKRNIKKIQYKRVESLGTAQVPLKTTVIGRVLLNPFFNPLEGAKVSIGNIEATTDQSGEFILRDVPTPNEENKVILAIIPPLSSTFNEHFRASGILRQQEQHLIGFILPAPSVFIIPSATLDFTPLAFGSVATAFRAVVNGPAKLANITASAVFDASDNLPTTLGGARVLIDGVPTGLFFVSPEQINFYIPKNLSLGKHSIVFELDGVIGAGKNQEISDFDLGLYARSTYRVPEGSPPPHGIIQNYPGYEFNTPSKGLVRDLSPAGQDKPDIFIAYGTGLGKYSESSLGLTAYLNNNIAVPLKVLYAGPAIRFPGLDQINIEIPKNFPVFSPQASPASLLICDAQIQERRVQDRGRGCAKEVRVKIDG